MEPGEMTIDQLAAEVGMTVRNIRAHQSRGLLPAPRIVGRTGYYGPAHQRRLSQIQAMQDQGLNLAAISRVVTDGRLTDLVVAPFADAEPAPERWPPEVLIERLQLAADDPAIDRAIELGLISFAGNDVLVAMPRLVQVAAELADQGVPLGAMLEAVAVVQEASRRAADAFMALADEHLVARVAVDAGGDLDQIRTSVEQLRVHASQALGILFDHAMADAVRTYFEGPTTPQG